MKRSIEVTVSPAGVIQIDAQGFQGPDCEAATRYLEEALGTIGTRTKKPEYHQRTVNHQKQTIGK
jgi:hypothetical protein